MTKPETKQVDEWAAGTAYVVEKSRLRQGDPDPRHIMATAIIISQHLDPAVKKLVEAAWIAEETLRHVIMEMLAETNKPSPWKIEMRQERLGILQSALAKFKKGE